MSGIVMLKTGDPQRIKEFYLDRVGCEPWMDYETSFVLRNGNFLFGFQESEQPDTGGILNFFFGFTEEVDDIFEELKDIAVAPPSNDGRGGSYHFFAKDPEGRILEFQSLQSPTNDHLTGDRLLMSRRNSREFSKQPVSDEVFYRVLDVSRFTPTSRNPQFFYLKLIKNKRVLSWLSKQDGKITEPIGKAPMAVAILSDPSLTKRHVEDGCIAAYHFMLSAWVFGLGTSWVPGMDREDVKNKINVPVDHYIATITPLGYPEKIQLDPLELEETMVLE